MHPSSQGPALAAHAGKLCIGLVLVGLGTAFCLCAWGTKHWLLGNLHLPQL